MHLHQQGILFTEQAKSVVRQRSRQSLSRHQLSRKKRSIEKILLRGEAELRTSCDTTRSIKMNEDSCEKTWITNRMQNQHRKKIDQAVIKPKIP